MSEPAGETRGPLHSDRGVTVIAEGVVVQLAGMAASEVGGVHMGNQTVRAAGGLLGGVTGSSGTRRGVTAEVGLYETALDLTMGLDYGKNILETTEAVRRNVRARVESLTGLKVMELNITINDIVFPEDGPPRGYGSSRERATAEAPRAEAPEEAATDPGPASERPTRRAEPRERDTASAPAADETAELNLPRERRERDEG